MTAPAQTSRRRSGLLPHLDLGDGPPVVIMQGFALQPRTYLGIAERLAEHCRVVIPSLFSQPGTTWSPAAVLSALVDLLDHLGISTATLLGHSFGGALQLCFAVEHPHRVEELVFVDTLAMSREWTLAAEAVHPIHLMWMATPAAAVDFARSALTHPLCLARAGWWGFRSDRREQVATLARSGIPRHVLWANRDSLLSRSDGAAFASDMGANFQVVEHPGSGPVDHDWIYRHPDLAMEQLRRLGLGALRARGEGEPEPEGTRAVIAGP